MEDGIGAIVRDAIAFAEESPYPEPPEALEDVFA
jgi:pyruvate dehydrogenase E1 component alpha subunit